MSHILYVCLLFLFQMFVNYIQLYFIGDKEFYGQIWLSGMLREIAYKGGIK